MGIEEDFYATIKLKTGEEIFTKVAASEEEEKTVLIISNPITVTLVKSKSGLIDGYKFEPWLKTTTEDMFIINISDVITMSESSDIEMIMMYENYIRNLSKGNSSNSKLNRRMGYISNIKDAKELLEKLYKSS